MPSALHYQFTMIPTMYNQIIFDGFAIQSQHCTQHNILNTTFDGVISDYECNQVFEKIMEASEKQFIYKWSFDLSNMYIHPQDLQDILTYWFPRLHVHSQGKGIYAIILPKDAENRQKFVDVFEKGICRKGCAYYFAEVEEAYHWLAGQGSHEGQAPAQDENQCVKRQNYIRNQ